MYFLKFVSLFSISLILQFLQIINFDFVLVDFIYQMIILPIFY